MRSTPALSTGLLALGMLATPAVAAAEETVDVGVLKKEDISVVQKMAFSKDGKTEYGLHLGIMPFDRYTTTPMAAFTAGHFFSEAVGAELQLAGGYGLTNGAFHELTSDAYGISPDAYRYLGSAMLDVQWSPIYAKINFMGKKVVHHDIYGLAGLGLTVEQAVIPDHSMAFGPTLGLGLGTRLFMGKSSILRVQIKDDIFPERRVKTADSQGTFLKQNVAITVGYTRLGGGK